jgi:hypothetical protein
MTPDQINALIDHAANAIISTCFVLGMLWYLVLRNK